MKFYKHLRRVSVSSSIVNTTLDKVRLHVSTKDLEKITEALQHLRSLYGETLTLAQLFTECDAALTNISLDNAGFIASSLVSSVQNHVAVALSSNENYVKLRDQTIERGYIGAGDAGIIRDRARIACFALLSVPDAKNAELEMIEAKIRLRHQVSASLIHFDRLQMTISEEYEEDEEDEGGVVVTNNTHPLYIINELINNRWFAPSVEQFAQYFNQLPTEEGQRLALFMECLLDYICTNILTSIQEHNPNFAKEIERITMLECFEPDQFIEEELVQNAILETIRNIARDFFDYDYDDSTGDQL